MATADVARFLATDKVPETLFGIPVVQDVRQYTKKDIDFFRAHPEAGGYYDLGDGTPEDGSPEGAPVQADEPKPHGKHDRRKFAMSFEQPLVTEVEKDQNGKDVTYVIPQKDNDGQFTAGGYHYYKGDDGALVAYTKDTGRVTLAQWTGGADMIDEVNTKRSSRIADTLGIARGSSGEDVLWDLAFNLQDYDNNMSRKKSPKLFTMSDALKAFSPQVAGTAALLVESASYGKNNGRNMARSRHMLEALRESKDPDERVLANIYDKEFAKAKPGSKGTKEEREAARHNKALKSMRAVLTDMANKAKLRREREAAAKNAESDSTLAK